MKTRTGFVSNSSSSSFIINKKDLTKRQIDKINNHIEEAVKMSDPNKTPEGYDFQYGWKDTWTVLENETEVHMFTTMNNFSMYEFLIDIGIEDAAIKEGEEEGVWD